MTDKLEGFKQPEHDEKTTERQSAALEEGLLDVDERLQPDDSVEVPGEEAAAPESGSHDKRMKKLYDRSRRDRESMIKHDGEAHPSAELVRVMVEEASGGKESTVELDTNEGIDDGDPEVPDAFRDEVRREREQEKAKATEEEGDEEQEEDSAGDSLPHSKPDDIVGVKVLGKEYFVPQQDIDDAGGVELYQKQRAANLRLQRIATLERALTEPDDTEEQQADQPNADPSTDGLDKADIKRLRERVVEAMVDGDDLSAVDAVLEEEIEKLSRQQSTSKPETKALQEPERRRKPVAGEAQAELQRLIQEDVQAANVMMREEYSDVMNDPQARARATSRFNALRQLPDNDGRTHKELSREAAEWARKTMPMFGNQPSKEEDRLEKERKRRIERKRKLPQPSRANAKAEAQRQPEEELSTKQRRRKYLQELQRRSQGA